MVLTHEVERIVENVTRAAPKPTLEALRLRGVGGLRPGFLLRVTPTVL